MKRIAIVFAIVFALSGIASAQEITMPGVTPLYATNTPPAEDAALPAVIVTDAPVEIVGYVEQPMQSEPAMTRTEFTLLLVVVVLAILLSVFVGAFVVFARSLLAAAPEWVKDIVRVNAPVVQQKADVLTGDLVSAAKNTPNPLDDVAATFIRDTVRDAVKELLKDYLPRSEADHDAMMTRAEG